MTTPTAPQGGYGDQPSGYQPPAPAPAPAPAQSYPQPAPGQPYPQPTAAQPYQQPAPGQPYPQQPIPGQPYPQQPIPGQPYPGQPYQQPAPGQPYPQQGQGQWGWAGQPGAGQTPPAQSAPQKGGHGLRNGIIGLVVLVLVVGGGLGFVLHSRTGTMKVAWAVNTTKGNDSLVSDFSGSWASPTSVADGRVDGVIDYSLKNGAQNWNWPVPTGSSGCQMSRNTSDGIGVFAYGTSVQRCDHLVALKLDTGEQVWPRPITLPDLPKADLSASTEPNTAISVDSGVMAVVNPDSTLGVYDLAGGKKLWQTSKNSSDSGPYCDAWSPSVIANTVYVLSGCSQDPGGTVSVSLAGYNAHSGAKTWTGQIGNVTDADTVTLGSDPASGYLFVTESSDSAGKRLLSFSVPKGSGSATPTTIKVDDYDFNGYAIHGHTLYVQGTRTGSTNNVNAVDLTTGKKLWTKSIPGDSITVVSADDDGAQVITSKDWTSPFQLVTLSASSGDESDGPKADDDRIVIQADDSIYLENGYLAVLPNTAQAGQAELFVLSGAKLP